MKNLPDIGKSRSNSFSPKIFICLLLFLFVFSSPALGAEQQTKAPSEPSGQDVPLVQIAKKLTDTEKRIWGLKEGKEDVEEAKDDLIRFAGHDDEDDPFEEITIKPSGTLIFKGLGRTPISQRFPPKISKPIRDPVVKRPTPVVTRTNLLEFTGPR